MPTKKRDDLEDVIETNPDLERNLEKSGAGREKKKAQPSYKVFEDTKIAVSSKMGKLWKARWQQGKTIQNRFKDAWDEAERYYNHDQMDHRTEHGPEKPGNRWNSGQLSETFTETENIVYANASTMVPVLYARNPRAEFTATNAENDGLATAYERLINVLISMKEAPGINLKPPMRKAVLMGQLANHAWLEIGWNKKENSIENSLQELDQINGELAKTKDTRKIVELEGKLMAIEKNVEILQPEGFFRRYRRPGSVIVDPASEEPDLSDAKWVAIEDFVPTEWLIARFMNKKGDGQHALIFEPTHVLPSDKIDIKQDELDGEDFQLITEGSEAKTAGYEDEDSYKHAWRTRVWNIWDKTTRRVYMFHHDDWTWPIWVWNDPYKLLRFFPVFGLQFHASTYGMYSKGEVTYYLDQQDAINEINSEERTARRWARRNLFFDTSTGLTETDVQKILKGADGTARGIKVPEGRTLKDAITSVIPPGFQNFPQLFDTGKKLQAIGRLSAVGDVLRGEQFKTNTTNLAIENYQTAQGIRIDEKTDAIEDMLGELAFAMAQIVGQFMQAETVSQLIGPEAGAKWRNLDPEEFRTLFNMNIVGGSTAKPTSAQKRREALEIGQVLGQFTSSPAAGPVVLILLRMFQQAFDEIVIKDEDWDLIMQAMQQGLQQSTGGQGTSPGQTNGTANGQAQVQEQLASLPDDVKAQVAALIQQGVPPTQALQQVVQATSQTQ